MWNCPSTGQKERGGEDTRGRWDREKVESSPTWVTSAWEAVTSWMWELVMQTGKLAVNTGVSMSFSTVELDRVAFPTANILATVALGCHL